MMRLRREYLVQTLFAAVLVMGCDTPAEGEGSGGTGTGETGDTSDGDSVFPCEPGDELSCTCDDGTAGTQECLSSGYELGPCQCEPDPDRDPGDDGDGSTGDGGGGSDGGDDDGGDDGGSDDGDTGGGDGPTCDWAEGTYGDCANEGQQACGDEAAQCANNSDGTVGVCLRECSEVCDCWEPPGSEFTVACKSVLQGSEAMHCILDCSDGKPCPEGMECYGEQELCVFPSEGGGGGGWPPGGDDGGGGGWPPGGDGGTGGWPDGWPDPGGSGGWPDGWPDPGDTGGWP